MIRNDEQWAVVRDQLSRIENALASLRRRVKNERNFALYSEGYVDQIAELKSEIAKYRAVRRKDAAARSKPSAAGKHKAARKRQKT